MNQSIRRLYRSRDDRWIAGVCGGIAEYSRIDPTVVRLALVAVSMFTALLPGILAYLAAWVVMPEEPSHAPASARPVQDNGA